MQNTVWTQAFDIKNNPVHISPTQPNFFPPKYVILSMLLPQNREV